MQDGDLRGSYGYDDGFISDNEKPFVQHNTSSSQKHNARQLADQDPFICSSSVEVRKAYGTAHLTTPRRTAASRFFKNPDSTPQAPSASRRRRHGSSKIAQSIKRPMDTRSPDVTLDRGRIQPATPLPYSTSTISYKATLMSAPPNYTENSGKPHFPEENAPKLCPVLADTHVNGLSRNNSAQHTPCETLAEPRSSLESDHSLQLGLSCDSRIYFSLFGEILSLDLAALTPNSEVIIELLKTAQSEKANYMIAGAYYRRIGLLESAKSIAQAMVNEFSSKGQPESSLKPVFLFLASCEMDLAKTASTTKSSHSVVTGHTRSAKQWLQKVYGKADPFREDDKENLSPAFRSNDPTPHREAPKAVPKPSPTGPIHGELKMLKNEVQSLRVRHRNQVQQLEDLTEAKRKADDECYFERNTRRKYQDRIKTLEKERDSARKMETFALEQVKREVAARREGKQRV
ncbi:hypothetical protein CPB83DRAFT_857417 [Crepidotus variabilis]|uniref:Uncharacterized protein n=1 Tax=Crepidotus variabilis TaxID=179855 RepID=A0A9P6ECT3_9AGAR|nr:hypothetical protein CPB83DRAFT_857417 [Crepidotus variabilis]